MASEGGLSARKVSVMESNVIKHIVMWKLRGETPEQRRQNAGQLAESFHLQSCMSMRKISLQKNFC